MPEPVPAAVNAVLGTITNVYARRIDHARPYQGRLPRLNGTFRYEATMLVGRCRALVVRSNDGYVEVKIFSAGAARLMEVWLLGPDGKPLLVLTCPVTGGVLATLGSGESVPLQRIPGRLIRTIESILSV